MAKTISHHKILGENKKFHTLSMEPQKIPQIKAKQQKRRPSLSVILFNACRNHGKLDRPVFISFPVLDGAKNDFGLWANTLSH